MIRDTRVRRRGGGDLSMPRDDRRLGVSYNPDAFGRFSEGIARYLGTARYLVWQTAVIIIWLVWNTFMPERVHFDDRGLGFTLLTLVLSLQASYAAPLILLAQNRQESRDRSQTQIDREVAERTQNETEFLARELAGLRLMVSNIASSYELREQLDELNAKLDALITQRGDATDDDRAPTEQREARAVGGDGRPRADD